jgi:hypothetical protein
VFDRNGVTFVSVTQSFNTTTSMGRLTLNILLSFAQFEREVTAERIRDKFAANRKQGMWMGGTVHWFSRSSLEVFLAGMEGQFRVEVRNEPFIDVSLRGLPRQPTIMVMPPRLLGVEAQ